MSTSAYASPFSMSSLRELETVLASKGFRPWAQQSDSVMPGAKVLWQKRLPDSVQPVCRCNDKLHLNITLYEVRNPQFSMQGGGPEYWDSVEAEICGELPDTQWAKLQIYSLKPDDVRNQLERIQDKLVSAWQAMAALSPEAIDQGE